MQYRATSKVDKMMLFDGFVAAKDASGRDIKRWKQVPVPCRGTVTTPVDLSAWVRSGYLIEVAPPPPPPVEPPPVEPEPVEPEPVEPEPCVEEVASKDDADYEELQGGGFKCLHCGKEYKPSPRAEANIKRHVQNEH